MKSGGTHMSYSHPSSSTSSSRELSNRGRFGRQQRWCRRLDRLETGRKSLHGTARTRRRPQLDPRWTEVAWPRATERPRRHSSPAVARGRQRQAYLGEKERRGVRNTRTQLARAEKTRSSEDGVAASSARPTMAAAAASFGSSS
jgi:hypothetical protein